MQDKLNEFYKELKELLNKHDLTMECYDNYDGREEWCGVNFTLRSKTPVNDRYEIYMTDIRELVDNGSD